MRFLWTDIETTGLDVRRDLILAIGIVLTEGLDGEIARGEWIVGEDPLVVDALLTPVVREMHAKSGLLARVAAVHAHAAPRVARLDIERWLFQHLGEPQASPKDRPAWAGNSVHFDKAFLEAQMPEVASHYSYRCLDVSTLKLLAIATVPGAKEWNDAQPEAPHTPLADLEGSRRELEHWRRVLREAP